MTTVATLEPVPFDIADDARRRVAGSLNAWLADLVALSLRLKQAHWNLRGSRFKSVHEQLDEILADVRVTLDDVAERVVTLGAAADGRPSRITEQTTLGSFPPGRMTVEQAVRQCCTDIAATVQHGRRCRADLAETDAVSDDLAITALAMLEKHHWMLRSQIEAP